MHRLITEPERTMCRPNLASCPDNEIHRWSGRKGSDWADGGAGDVEDDVRLRTLSSIHPHRIDEKYGTQETHLLVGSRKPRIDR